MKRKVGTVAFYVFFGCVLLSGCDTSHNIVDPGKSYFLKYYGGDGYQTGVDVELNSDGTFILFGTSGKSADVKDAYLYLVKADAYGNIIWQTQFGGPYGNEARDVEILGGGDAGNIIVVANVYNAAGVRQIMVQKFGESLGNKIGDSAFLKVYNAQGVAVTQDVNANSITQLNNGDFIVAGSSGDLAVHTGVTHSQDGLEVKIHGSDLSTYDFSWKPVQGDGSYNVSTRAFQLSDNSYFVAGYSNPVAASDFNFVLLKVSQTGEISSPSYAGDSVTAERLGDAVMTYSEAVGYNFYMAGISTSGTQSDIYVAQLSLGIGSQGDTIAPVVFNKKAGLSLNTPGSSAARLAVAPDGSLFVLTTTIDLTSGTSNMLLAKRNALGGDPELSWISPRMYGGVGDDVGGAVRLLPDGKIILCGTMSINGESKMALIKVNENGGFSD